MNDLWITFPDPQMKKATKRLTSTYFMQRYLQVMRPDSTIHLKTDSPFLYTYTRAMLHENGCKVLVDTDDLYAASTNASLIDARALQTHYEKQWLQRGMSIRYLCWQPGEHAWKEPDIEIEKDTYRSYGRNYTTDN